jgi:predicted nicotinamide N-methyase
MTSSIIERETIVAPPALCPELRIRQITPACRLWRATEDEAASAGIVEPYWAFCWAGGQAIARHLLDGPDLSGARVLDFGSGCGICGIAAALRGAEVLAADIDPTATEATSLNAALNRVGVSTTTDDLIGRFDHVWNVVLAGDMTYERALTDRVLEWLRALTERGSRVLVGDPGRGFIDANRLEALATYETPADNDPGESFYVRTTVYRVGVASARGA